MNISYVQSESNDINQLEIMLEAGTEPEIFVWGAKYDTNTFIKTTSTHIYIHIRVLFYYIYTLFI